MADKITIREIAIALGFEVDESAVSEAESAIRAITETVSETVQELKEGLSDSFSDMEDKVSQSTDELVRLNSEYPKIAATARQLNTELEAIQYVHGNIRKGVETVRNAYGTVVTKVNVLKKAADKVRKTQQNVTKAVNLTKQAYPLIGNAANKVSGIIGKVKQVQDKLKKSVTDTKNEYREVGSTVAGLKSKLTGIIGALGIGIGIAQMNSLSEEFNGVNDSIKNATADLGVQKEIQEKILKSANDTKSSYADTAKVVTSLVQENKEMFGNIDDAIAFNDVVTKTFKNAGKSNEEIAGLMEAINKSFAKGKVDTETLNQLMERSPEAVALLEKQLGTTKDKFEEMVSKGSISLNDLKDAFMNNSEQIGADFDNLNYSMSDALLNIRNKWGYWLDDINSSTLLTQTLAKFFTRASDAIMSGLNKVRDVAVKVTDKFGGMENVFKFVAIAAGAIFLALKGGAIIAALKGMASMLNIANLKMLALKLKTLGIIAVFILIGLVIEDFINFLQGNNSVIGQVLEKLGYDSEAVREKVLTAWGKIKDFLLNTWNNIKEMAANAVQALKDFWAEWGDEITQVVKIAIDTVIKVFNDFISFIQGFIQFIEGIFNGDFEQALDGLEQMFKAVLNAIKDLFTGIFDAIYVFFGDKIDAMVEKVKAFYEKVKEFFGKIGDFFGGIGDFFGDIGDFVTGGNKADVKNTTLANSTGGGNKTNNVNQNVEIKQTFNGTDQKTISNAASAAADDTTSKLAKGLAYGT